MKVIQVDCGDLTYLIELLIILKKLHVLDENGKLLSYCGQNISK